MRPKGQALFSERFRQMVRLPCASADFSCSDDRAMCNIAGRRDTGCESNEEYAIGRGGTKGAAATSIVQGPSIL
jgi:hypothetical protein